MFPQFKCNKDIFPVKKNEYINLYRRPTVAVKKCLVSGFKNVIPRIPGSAFKNLIHQQQNIHLSAVTAQDERCKHAYNSDMNANEVSRSVCCQQ